jgi:HEAT repeat protein
MPRRTAWRGLLTLALWGWLVPVIQGQGPGEPAKLQDMLKKLHESEAAVRRVAALDLAGYRKLSDHAEQVIGPLIDALKYKDNIGLGTFSMSGNDSLREIVVKALLKSGPKGEKALVEKGLPILTANLEKEEPAVQDHTLRVLGQMGSRAAAAMPLVEKMTGSADDSVRRKALEALGRMGPEGERVLLRLAKQGNAAMKREVLESLHSRSDLGEAFVAPLIDLLNDPVPAVRCNAAYVLKVMGPTAKAAVPNLLKRLGDQELEGASKLFFGGPVVHQALAAIGEPAIPGLIEALDSKDPGSRLHAMDGLGQIGPRAKAALTPLRQALAENTLGPVLFAAIAMLRIDPQAEPAIKALTGLLDHPDTKIRVYVLTQLAKVQPPCSKLLPAVEILLKDKDPQVARAAVRVVVRYESDALPALPALIAVLDEPLCRSDVIQYLQDRGPQAKDAVPALVKCLKDKDFNVTSAAAWALGAIGPAASDAVPALTEALEGDYFVQSAALLALGQIGPGAKSAVPAIVKVLQNPRAEREDAAESLRDYALQALADLGPSAREAVPALSQMLKDAKVPRAGVIRALGRIGPDARAAEPHLRDRLRTAKGATFAEIQGALAQISEDRQPHVKALLDHYQDIPAGAGHKLDRRTTLEVLALLGNRLGPPCRI